MANRLSRRDKVKLSALFLVFIVPMVLIVVGVKTETRGMWITGASVLGPIFVIAMVAAAVGKVREVQESGSMENPPDALLELAILPMMFASAALYCGLAVAAHAVWGQDGAAWVVFGAPAMVAMVGLFGTGWLDRMWNEAWSDWCHGRRTRSAVKYSVQVLTGGWLLIRSLFGAMRGSN